MYRLNRAQVRGVVIFMTAMFIVVSWSIVSDRGWSLHALLAIGIALVVMLITMVVFIPIGLALRRALFGDDRDGDDREDDEYLKRLRDCG